jgi:hypothetical protein
MSTSPSARILPALRLAGAAVVLAAGIAGFATTDRGADAGSVQLDLAVVTTTHGH